MEPFRGKASGKTRVQMGRATYWVKDVVALEERIAELEAELADLREYKDWQETTMQGLPDAYRKMQARAEKAEAEKEQGDWQRTEMQRLLARAEKAEAEVERLSLLAQKPRENDPNYWPKCGHLPHAGTCYEPPEVARKERDDG